MARDPVTINIPTWADLLKALPDWIEPVGITGDIGEQCLCLMAWCTGYGLMTPSQVRYAYAGVWCNDWLQGDALQLLTGDYGVLRAYNNSGSDYLSAKEAIYAAMNPSYSGVPGINVCAMAGNWVHGDIHEYLLVETWGEDEWIGIIPYSTERYNVKWTAPGFDGLDPSQQFTGNLLVSGDLLKSPDKWAKTLRDIPAMPEPWG